MALNKFYNAINATLTLPRNEAFELAERQKGKRLENRSDAESNQACSRLPKPSWMLRITTTQPSFSPVFSSLNNWGIRTVVSFNSSRDWLITAGRGKPFANSKKLTACLRAKNRGRVGIRQNAPCGFCESKEVLRSYGTLYPQSPYVPEAHYLLALTYEQLGQDEESVKELLLLLRESDFNPEMILNLEQGRPCVIEMN